MNTKSKIVVLAIILMLCAAGASAQSASGTLAVSATITGSINMTFVSDGSGVALGGSGTNSASLNFGSNVSAYGTFTGLGTTIARTYPDGSHFMIATPFDVKVVVANSSSPSCKLLAQLSNADATNAWSVSGTTVTSTAAATINTAQSYGSAVPYQMQLTIPLTEAATTVSNTMNFTATAN